MPAALVHDPETRFLGKLEAKPPHAMLRDFVDIERAHAAFTVPANIINSATTKDGTPMAIALAMYLNDKEGDCTIAGKANTIRVNSNDEIQPTDDEVQTDYVRNTGEEGAAYDPATGTNDNGCNELDVLDDWVKNPLGGEQLLGHAGIDMTSETEWRLALYLTGSIYPGWALSTDQQSQPIWGPGQAQPGSWGGHCAPIFDHWTEIPAGLVIGGVPIEQSVGDVFNVGTWEQYKPCLGGAKGFIPFACDEGHALILKPWVEKAQALGIIDVTKLEAYLKTLRQEA